MATKNLFFHLIRYVLLALCSVSWNVHAVQRQPANVQDDEGFIKLNRLINGSREISKPLQRIEELKAIPGTIRDIENQIRVLNASKLGLDAQAVAEIDEQINAWKEAKQDLFHILKTDSKMGKAIAFGLAGNDMLQNMRVENVAEGAKLGVSMCAAQALSERIKNSVDRVIGGTWDAIISAIIDSWNTVSEVLFHSGGQPLTMKEIKGWQDLIKVSFEDITRLLKDGFKDSMRGADMTLRQIQGDDEDVQNDQDPLSAWKILVDGYVRQFDYIVSQLDKRLVYYNEEEMITFYIQEIKRQLLETNKLLTYGNTLKELDALLDSNKTLIPALKQNILNLFTRLAELIEPPSSSFRQTNKSSGSSDSSSKGMGRSSFEDEGMPRPFSRY